MKLLKSFASAPVPPKKTSRRGADHRHRREVAQQVVGQAGHHRRRDGMRELDDGGRVAIRGGAGSGFGADLSGGTGPVVHDDGNPHRAAHALRDRACNGIGAASGSPGHDQLDRPVGKGGPGPRRCGHQRGGAQEGAAMHW
jgi:hypothetical protein